MLVVSIVVCACLPLHATIISLEDFNAVGVPPGWSTSVTTGFAVSIPGTGDAIFTKAPGTPDGYGRLTYNTVVSGDFLAVGVVSQYSLVNNSMIQLAANWSGGADHFTALLVRGAGQLQQRVGNTLTMEFLSAPWSSPNAILLLFRAGNNIQAGVMSDIPLTSGVPDFSGFSPLGSWTGDQYLGDVTLYLSLGTFAGATGAPNAGIDTFALVVPPYAPDIIPPAAIPEPVTAGLAAAGLAAFLLLRRQRQA